MTDRQDKMTCREGQSDRPLPEITTENINRDYTTENKYALSESKDSSRGDIYAFSTEKGGSKSNVIKNLAVEFADCEPSDWRIEELKHIIDYFLEQYNKTLNMSHIRITEQALTKIVINYFEPVGNYMSDNSAYGFDDYYKELIDYYLQTTSLYATGFLISSSPSPYHSPTMMLWPDSRGDCAAAVKGSNAAMKALPICLYRFLILQ